MKKFVGKILVGVMLISAMSAINVSAATVSDVASGGYESYEGVGLGRTAITNPVQTQSIQSGWQRGFWTRGVTSTMVVSETVSVTGEGRASIITGYNQQINGGWRPTHVYSFAYAPRSAMNFTDRVFWDLR